MHAHRVVCEVQADGPRRSRQALQFKVVPKEFYPVQKREPLVNLSILRLVNSIEYSTRRQHETRCCAMGEMNGDSSKRRAIENRIQSQFDGGDVNHTLDRIWQGFDVDFALVQDLLNVLIDHVRRHARWQRAGARGPRASISNDQPCWCARGGGTAGLAPLHFFSNASFKLTWPQRVAALVHFALRVGRCAARALACVRRVLALCCRDARICNSGYRGDGRRWYQAPCDARPRSPGVSAANGLPAAACCWP